MGIKDELLKLKKILTDDLKIDNVHKNTENDKKTIDRSLVNLDNKISDFINWYFDNMIKGNYSEILDYGELTRLRNFIEKMAVWYELRYPDYEIAKLMYCGGQEQIDVNEVMFQKNSYINDLFDDKADVRDLDWDEFYNANVFIKSLPWEERFKFTKPKYKHIVYLNPNSKGAHLHLTKNGVVEMSEGVSIYTNSVIKDDELVGLYLKKVLSIFKEKGIKLPENNELEKNIRNADNWIYQKEEMLNCVMYRIIERGGNRIGPRRAFLFAEEFNRDIDIPMKYAVDYSDPGLRLFINEYIKAGGSKDLECYVGYFSKRNKKDALDITTIKELILTHSNKSTMFYTPEENDLHLRLVSILSDLVNQEEIKQEEIKRLRLERKLEKSKMNKGI